MSHDKWRARLETLRADLTSLDETSADGRSAVELDQAKVGRLSRMDALQHQAMNNAIAARRKQQLVQIEAALERLEEGEYGYCIECGDEIAEKRLVLDPVASRCTRCAGA